jgi:hypothetical protein
MAKEDDTPKELLEALALVRDAKLPQLESLDALELKHVERVRNMFEDPNIVGVGISEKETEKKAVGGLALCFYVERKLPKSKVKATKMVPPVLSVADRNAVFTDVKAIGKVLPQINRRQSPILSGYSVGNVTDTGTLGAIVRKQNKLFLLSNSHVLAKSGKGKAGDAIFYPGRADLDGAKEQRVGTLSGIFPFQQTEDFVNRFDAALAEVDKPLLDSLDLSIHLAKKPIGTVAPVRGMTVVKRGRTSGNSEGTVEDVHFSIAIKYPGVGKIGFIDQVLCTRYTKSGDSGSIVVDKKSGNVVGLHFAGSTKGSVFSPISAVLSALKIQFA